MIAIATKTVEYVVKRKQILPHDLAVSVAVSEAVARFLMPKKVRRRGESTIGDTRRPRRGIALNDAKCRECRELSLRDDASLRPNRSAIYNNKTIGKRHWLFGSIGGLVIR